MPEGEGTIDGYDYGSYGGSGYPTPGHQQHEDNPDQDEVSVLDQVQAASTSLFSAVGGFFGGDAKADAEDGHEGQVRGHGTEGSFSRDEGAGGYGSYALGDYTPA